VAELVAQQPFYFIFLISLLQQNIVKENIRMICKVENCKNDVFASGYCQRHYMQIRRNQKITDGLVKTCCVDGCTSKHLAKGYCSKHYRQITLKGAIQNYNRLCKIDECKRKSRALGYCLMHYTRIRRSQKSKSHVCDSIE
jgi:hypothetical protein